jgi:hypothetical protein
MRYVVIPETIHLRDPQSDLPIVMVDPETKKETKAEITFPQFIRLLFQDERMYKGSSKDIFGVSDLRTSMLAKADKPGEIVELRDEDYTFLEPIVKAPTTFSPGVILQTIPFLRAIKDAATVDPRPQADEAKK